MISNEQIWNHTSGGSEVFVNNIDVSLGELASYNISKQLQGLIYDLSKAGLLDHADALLSKYHADSEKEIYNAIAHGLGKLVR